MPFMKIERVLIPPEGGVNVPDGATILDVDWRFTNFSDSRTPEAVWIARPVDE